jgi:hypothetical protein
MADQATLSVAEGLEPNRSWTSSGGSSSGRTTSADGSQPSAVTMVSNVAGFGENLLNLAELQAQLSAAELRKNLDAAKISGIIALGGSVLAIASVPVALAGIAELLVSELALSRGIALLIVAAAAIAIAAACVLGAGIWLRQKRLGFPVTSEEFNRNLHWLRTVLRYSGRPPAARRQ